MCLRTIKSVDIESPRLPTRTAFKVMRRQFDYYSGPHYGRPRVKLNQRAPRVARRIRFGRGRDWEMRSPIGIGGSYRRRHRYPAGYHHWLTIEGARQHVSDSTRVVLVRAYNVHTFGGQNRKPACVSESYRIIRMVTQKELDAGKLLPPSKRYR